MTTFKTRSPRHFSTRRLIAYLVIVVCFAVVLLAFYHSLLVPRDGTICGEVMLVVLLVYLFALPFTC